MTRLRFSCITASTDVMQKLYLEIDSPYKASRAFNRYALNLAPCYSLSYLNFSCCEGIHMQYGMHIVRDPMQSAQLRNMPLSSFSPRSRKAAPARVTPRRL